MGSPPWPPAWAKAHSSEEVAPARRGAERMSNLNTFGAPSPAADHKSKLAYIDCLRGYAVLLVIATHTVEVYRQMPYPVHKLATFG